MVQEPEQARKRPSKRVIPEPSLLESLGPLGDPNEVLGQNDVRLLLQLAKVKGMDFEAAEGDIVPHINIGDPKKVPYMTLPREYYGTDIMPGDRHRDPQANLAVAVMIALVALDYVQDEDDPIYIADNGMPYFRDEIYLADAWDDNGVRRMKILSLAEPLEEGNTMRSLITEYAADLLVSQEEWILACKWAREKLGEGATRRIVERYAIDLLEGPEGLLIPKGTVNLRRNVPREDRGLTMAWLENGEEWSIPPVYPDSSPQQTRDGEDALRNPDDWESIVT